VTEPLSRRRTCTSGLTTYPKDIPRKRSMEVRGKKRNTRRPKGNERKGRSAPPEGVVQETTEAVNHGHLEKEPLKKGGRGSLFKRGGEGKGMVRGLPTRRPV